MFEEKLVEVIKDGQIMRVTKSEAEREDLFILNTPSNESFSRASANETLDLTNLRNSREKEREVKNKINNSLIDNFHWKIVQARREKNMTRKQLAEKLGISESSLKQIEYGELPRGNFTAINNIEEVLSIKLKKANEDSFNEIRRMIEKEQEYQAKEREKERALRKEKLGPKEEKKMADLLGEDIEIID